MLRKFELKISAAIEQHHSDKSDRRTFVETQRYRTECCTPDFLDVGMDDSADVEIVSIEGEFLVVEFSDYQRLQALRLATLLQSTPPISGLKEPEVKTMNDAAHAAFHLYCGADRAEVEAHPDWFVVRLKFQGELLQIVNIRRPVEEKEKQE